VHTSVWLPSYLETIVADENFIHQGDALTKADEVVAVALEISKQEGKETSTIFWDVTMWSLIEVYRRFGGMCLHPLGQRVSLLLSY
jgi:hypothetical protein